MRNTLQGKTKGANSKNKISGRANKNNAFFRYYPLQNKVTFCKNMRQVAKHCILHFTLVAVFKETLFPLLPVAEQSYFL